LNWLRKANRYLVTDNAIEVPDHLFEEEDVIEVPDEEDVFVYDGITRLDEWGRIYGIDRYAPTNVTKVEVADTVTKLSNAAFYQCDELTEIKISTSVTEIDSRAFAYCAKLKKVTIPRSVTEIGDYVFYDCAALTEITIPSSVTEIGSNVFEGCVAIKRIQMPPLNYTFHHCKALEHLTISEGFTTELPNYAFYGTALKTIKIQSSVIKIGDWAFGACESLEAVTVQSSTVELGDGVFGGCTNLSDVEMPHSITSFGNGVFGGCRNLPQQQIDEFRLRQSNTTLVIGPGSDLEYKGKTQNGWGPEWWGVSLEQIQKLKNHPFYKRGSKVEGVWKRNYLMREYVQSTIEPLTEGTGMGFALFMNQEKPLKARVMISHAWDEPICDFVEAIERSGEEGPFWICALSIYQNSDESKGVTIAEQLGSDPKFGPFATVLKGADLMLAVLTHECNIYTRLWCAYELYFARSNDVNVRLAPHIAPADLFNGKLQKDICVNEAENRVKSIEARCGRPGNKMNEDEVAIRKEVNDSTGGFDRVDEVVERIRLVHLLSYPMEKIKWSKSTARDSLKDAIESIIPCFGSMTKFQTFDDFLSNELAEYPGFKRIPRPEDLIFDGKHDYIISDGGTEHDVFKEWCASIHDALPKS